MGRYGVRPRLAGLVLLLPFAFLAADAQAALTKPERKAVDIKKVEAATATTATLVEIKFKGDVEAELGTGGLKKAVVTTELIPASGPTTVITDRKSSKKPKEQRKGTSGPFEVARDGKRTLVLVEALPEPIEDVAVTTSGPGKARGAKAGEFDEFAAKAGPLDTEEQIRDELDDAYGWIDEFMEDGEGGRTHQEEMDLYNRWIQHLESILSGETKRQCNDGVDNGDPEDTIVDHPTDPGCVEPVDNDEKDLTVPVTCPSQGARTSPFAVINTPQTNVFTSFVLRRAANGQEVLNSPVAGMSGGPSPLPGDVCGPGVTATFQWVVFTDGTPYGLEDPPPGDHGFCVFLDLRNPAGSGNPGGQDASLVFAVGTAPQ